MIKKKRTLRQVQRQAYASKKDKLISEIMEASQDDSKTFHKLLRIQRSNSAINTDTLAIDNVDYSDTTYFCCQFSICKFKVFCLYSIFISSFPIIQLSDSLFYSVINPTGKNTKLAFILLASVFILCILFFACLIFHGLNILYLFQILIKNNTEDPNLHFTVIK
jgi:hypothetical protein